MMALPALKPKTCKACRSKFVPARSTQAICFSLPCAIELVRMNKEKKAAAKARQDRRETKAAKDKAKTARDWLPLAQAAFNKFIRLRDADKPCISCGRVDVEWTRGGAWDCGHFLGRGAYPELRFEELNAHKQCKSCNGGSAKYARKGRTVANEYEARLIERIGQDKVDWLKGPHEPKHYTVDDLKAIKQTYQAKCKELECA